MLFFVFLVRIFTNWPLNEEQSDVDFTEYTTPLVAITTTLSERSLELLPQPQAALLMGMVLGVKGDLPQEFRRALTNTSTIHIVVVSGQNLTMLSGFILLSAPFMGRRKTILLSIATVVFYAVLTGLQVPVIRAGIMVIATFAAQLFNREGGGFRTLLITVLLMLIFNPHWLLSISFQLSVLATIGVVILAPALIERAKYIPDLIKQDLVVSLCAQLMVLPIIAINFHQLSLVGIVVNTLVLWTVPGVMIFGAAGLILSFISFELGQLMILIPGILLTYFVNIVEFFNQKWVSVYIGNYSFLLWIGYYLLILSFYLALKKSKNRENL